MIARRTSVFVSVLGMCLAVAAPAGAHRVDEYLQATRIAIGIDRVDLEIDLTAGTAIASEAAAWIDTNHDGRISNSEGRQYAQEVLRSIELSVDLHDVALTVDDINVPDLAQMSAGTGAVRLQVYGRMPAPSAGHHQVVYSNRHRSESSVYLVNALVPSDSRIQLTDQRRDNAQHQLKLEYTMAGGRTWTSFLLVGLAMAGVLGVSRLPRPMTPS